MFFASVAMQINLDMLIFIIVIMNITIFYILCRMENIGSTRAGVESIHCPKELRNVRAFIESPR